jgi:hypothetical protein
MGDCQIRTKWNEIKSGQEAKLLSEISEAQIALTPKRLFSIFTVSKGSSYKIKKHFSGRHDGRGFDRERKSATPGRRSYDLASADWWRQRKAPGSTQVVEQ